MPEEALDRHNVFDIPLLGSRLSLALRWVQARYRLPTGLFGASTGGGAALWAAGEIEPRVAAVVSRGGRPELAGDRLKDVTAPTLLLVGEKDEAVIELNRRALRDLKNAKLVLIPGATHLFEEPGALARVEEEAANWFLRHFADKNRAVA
jgi:putative phosphoribosyl transferase